MKEEKTRHSLAMQGENTSHNKPNCRVLTFLFSLKGQGKGCVKHILHDSKKIQESSPWLTINKTTPNTNFTRRWAAQCCVCYSSSLWIKGKGSSSWSAAGLWSRESHSPPTHLHTIPNLAFHTPMIYVPQDNLLFTVLYFPLSLPPESLPATTSPFSALLPSCLLCARQR